VSRLVPSVKLGPTQGTPTGDPHRGPTQRDPHREPTQGTHTGDPNRGEGGGPHRGPTTGEEGHTGDPHRTHTDKFRTCEQRL